MKATRVLLGICVTLGLTGNQALGQKEALAECIKDRSEKTWEMARKIWEWAEPGYQETKSAALLAQTLEEVGFKVNRGVAQIPTAFTATFGSGKPLIGILGEFDSLPGLSQTRLPVRQLRPGATYGHACGHHLFGVASASACLAIADQIRAGKFPGTVRYYGCPAEEGGAAKVFMVRAGLFNDCDVVLHWHPGSRNAAGDSTCLARMCVKFRFHGTSAHASASPEKGRSALAAVELTNHAAQLLREHSPDFTRIHHTITDGGGAPNVVPEFAEVYYYIRHPKAEVLAKLYPRLVKCAEAGALATETRLQAVYLGGTMEVLPNDSLAQIARDNLLRLNDLRYTEDEHTFAARIQETFAEKAALDSVAVVEDLSGKLGKGSTDVGDVSWVVPATGFSTACWVPGTSGHSWQAVAAGGMSIGRKGMDLAAKVLVATAWDLFQDPKLVAAAKMEQQRRLAGRTYQSLLEPDQKPPLDYRDPPRRK